MPKALLNDVRINYRQVGEGDDIVLIHGLAANHAFWGFNLCMPLARTYRVTSFDLRGHGYSDMPPSGYTTAGMAEDLVALLDHLAIDSAHLVGHSFGGTVALHFASLYPNRVKSLTIQDSRVRALQPTQRLRDWPDWQDAKAQLEEQGLNVSENEDDVGVKLLELLASPDWREKRQSLAKQPLFVPFAGWTSGNRSAAQWLRLLETTTARDDIRQTAGLTEEALRQIKRPILAIYGEHSRCMQTFERLTQVMPHCETAILRKVGHFFPLIKPAVVADLILDFVSQIGADEKRPFESDHVLPQGIKFRSGIVRAQARNLISEW